MNTIVCTLYEKNYHLGVAVLINSLYKNGFRGDFFVGYRGSLPPWVTNTIPNITIDWKGAVTFKPSTDLNVHFLPVETEMHFTNYKPYFMLEVWNKHIISIPLTRGICYFDPDIVNKGPWNFFERWIGYGVAVVHEIVYHDMPSSHPKRYQWKTISDKSGLEIINNLNSYVNAGFVGVSSENIQFIETWISLIETSVQHFNMDCTKFNQSRNGYDTLKGADQDLLNLSLMCTTCPISEYGPEGMDFRPGGWLMSHATGAPKPWNNNYLLQWLKGIKPSIQNKVYWEKAAGVIQCYSNFYIQKKIFMLKLSSFLSRFYSK